MTYRADLPVPSLVLAPGYLQFDKDHPAQSGTMTVYNPSRVEVDNVVVDGGNTPGVHLTLSYRDPASGSVVTGTAVTIPAMPALSSARIHYDGVADCPSGSGVLTGHITAHGVYLYAPPAPAISIGGAAGDQFFGSAAADMAITPTLSNSGQATMANIRMAVDASGGLPIDAPARLGDLAPLDAEDAPFALHTTGLGAGVYTATVTIAADDTPTSRLVFTATVDGTGNVTVSDDFLQGVAKTNAAGVDAQPAQVADESCAPPPPNTPPPPAPPAPPTVDFGPDGLVISYDSGPSGGEPVSIPPLPGVAVPPPPQPSINEVVQLTIPQRTTLERQGFDANLKLTNIAADPLQNVGVTITVQDATGSDQTNLFAITPPKTTGYAAGGGLGAIPVGGAADNDWTLVPSPGAGGTDAAGTDYSVTATYRYTVRGEPVEETTQPYTITVYPMPQLHVSYIIPHYVQAYQPFMLKVLVQNTGAGPAHNLTIASRQPQIVSNVSHALVGVSVIKACPPHGDIPVGGIVAGCWIMQADADGQVQAFSAAYQEEPYQGVRLSPLIVSEQAFVEENAPLPSDLGATGDGSGASSDGSGDIGPPDTQIMGPGTGSGASPLCQSGLYPVNCATGDFWHSFSDLAVPGRGIPLDFTRTYNALEAARDGPLGYGWTDSYSMTLTRDASRAVTAHEEGGSAVTFTPSGDGTFSGADCEAPYGVEASLVSNGDGTMTLTRHGGDQYTFDTPAGPGAGAGTGRLLRQTDRNGYVTRLDYDAGGRLATVTDPAGRGRRGRRGRGEHGNARRHRQCGQREYPCRSRRRGCAGPRSWDSRACRARGSGAGEGVVVRRPRARRGRAPRRHGAGQWRPGRTSTPRVEQRRAGGRRPRRRRRPPRRRPPRRTSQRPRPWTTARRGRGWTSSPTPARGGRTARASRPPCIMRGRSATTTWPTTRRASRSSVPASRSTARGNSTSASRPCRSTAAPRPSSTSMGAASAPARRCIRARSSRPGDTRLRCA